MVDIGRPDAWEVQGRGELALAILGFPDALAEVAAGSQPHRMATYLFDLAQAFTTFYEQCPVLVAETPELRASRLRAAAQEGLWLEVPGDHLRLPDGVPLVEVLQLPELAMMLATDLAVLDVTEQGLTLVELAEGVSFDELQAATGCPIVR